MLEILTVCTGNVCRSPFAEVILAAELPGVVVRSAGTRALIDHAMDADASRMAGQYGIPAEAIEAHRARWLNEGHLAGPDLVLAMSREHRREIAELAPARIRSTFTAREFARLSVLVPDAEALRLADDAGEEPRERLRALLAHIGGLRSEVEAPIDATADDVVDPYRRGWDSYELMATQLMPALAEVVRIARIAAGPMA